MANWNDLRKREENETDEEYKKRIDRWHEESRKETEIEMEKERLETREEIKRIYFDYLISLNLLVSFGNSMGFDNLKILLKEEGIKDYDEKELVGKKEMDERRESYNGLLKIHNLIEGALATYILNLKIDEEWPKDFYLSKDENGFFEISALDKELVEKLPENLVGEVPRLKEKYFK